MNINYEDYLLPGNYFIGWKFGKIHAVLSVKNRVFSFSLLQPSTILGKFRKLFWILLSFFLFEKKGSGFFIEKINEVTNSKVIDSSIYFSNDLLSRKVVLKILLSNGRSIFVKFGLNNIGRKRVRNEAYFYNLYKSSLLHSVIKFNSIEYIILKDFGEADFSFNFQSAAFNHPGLGQKNEHISIYKHPRSESIISSMNLSGIPDLITFSRWCEIKLKASNYHTFSTFEHGDYTQFNIAQTEGANILFDYEYSIENGLFEFDLIHYLYQYYTLICKVSSNKCYFLVKKELSDIAFMLPEGFIVNFDLLFVLYHLSLISDRITDGANQFDINIRNRIKFMNDVGFLS